MKLKTTGLSVLSMLLLAAPLTACTKNSPSDEAGTGAGASSPAATAAAGATGANGKTVVSVSVIQNDRFMQEAERLFEQANPNIDIDIRAYTATPESGNQKMVRQIGGNEKNEADLEKYRSSINTELMSGKGTDIIAVEELAYAKYANKKLLADLGPLMDKDQSFKKAEYFNKMFDAVKVNGKSYALPVYVALNAVVGNEPLLKSSGVTVGEAGWTWEELLKKGQQAAAANPQPIPVLTGKSKDSVVTDIVRSSYGRYVDAAAKKASFDSKEFIALIEQIRDMYDKGLLTETMDKTPQGNDVFKAMNMKGPMDLVMMPQMMYGGKGKFYGAPGGKGDGITFTSDLMLAINEKSKVKAEAWKFLSFLLSEQMQTLPGMFGTSVHKPSLEKQIKTSVENLASGKMKIAGPGGAIAAPDISEEGMKQLLSIVDKADSFATGDPNVMKIVREEAQAFFKKEKTAQAAAGMMQNRITTYLNE
jgi:multiple sugar transport system substrate-binding protein